MCSFISFWRMHSEVNKSISYSCIVIKNYFICHVNCYANNPAQITSAKLVVCFIYHTFPCGFVDGCFCFRQSKTIVPISFLLNFIWYYITTRLWLMLKVMVHQKVSYLYSILFICLIWLVYFNKMDFNLYANILEIVNTSQLLLQSQTSERDCVKNLVWHAQ